MNYPDAAGLDQAFKTNHWLIHQLVDGLNHADSIVQPPYQGNCLNWVLGHIIVSRNRVLKLLEVIPVWSDDEINLYDTGSKPITGDEQGIKFEDQLATLDFAQDRIQTALGEIGSDQLDLVVETSRGIKPVGKHISGLNWHETYHIGQLELLREIAHSSNS
jgi:DinB superfamily